MRYLMDRCCQPDKGQRGADVGGNSPENAAKPVPGDPTRVFNPLAPELTLRIVNKATGQPYPRDTKLKVPGTNFFFKIP